MNHANLPIFNWSIKKSFSYSSMQLIVETVWVSSEPGWRGLQGPQFFTRLTKASNHSQDTEQTFLRPGIRKVRTRKQQSGLPEQAGTAGNAGTFPLLPFPPSCHRTGALPPSLIPSFAGASPGLLNTKEALRGGARSCEPPGIRCRLGEGVDPETRRPERHRGVSPPSPRWAPAEDWSQTPHSPSPTRSRKLSPSPYLPAATKLWSVHTPLCCPRSPNSIKVCPERPCSPSLGKQNVSALCDPEG